MILNDVHTGIQKRKPRKRIGRGPGSGHGKTSGRGHNGYFSRSGSRRRQGFEGGQMPLFRRVAKRGFNNAAFADTVVIINVGQLEKAFDDGADVTIESLVKRGLIPGRHDALKVLGDGELSKKFTVKAHRFSKSAEQKIVAAGGKFELV
ncbi:50S ribosomal protein L15 [Fuerstiella marisgermanici]|uniref:Large ribosomal subunit protein uL15 n=1 Tax=Fuerstiella marisgermanici TaxID=1891926 RepID=A0A1P8WQ94_9PLAN|nr:50S ribosomal protein L15 [Fuerstiella marisgermanici]APZ96214.1 50S ribosomal protein L15 [Fuerstiella marisgermanici]